MNDIPTIYLRDWTESPRYVTREPNPSCVWVFAGEGTATRQYDGVCVRFDGRRWWARREVKDTDPPNFLLIEEDAEPGRRVGWEPVMQTGVARWFREALDGSPVGIWTPGTYELCGPQINGNPERFAEHLLISHDDADVIKPFALTWDGIRDTVQVLAESEGFEGIIWHHPDGRMAKIKARDYDLAKEDA